MKWSDVTAWHTHKRQVWPATGRRVGDRTFLYVFGIRYSTSHMLREYEPNIEARRWTWLMSTFGVRGRSLVSDRQNSTPEVIVDNLKGTPSYKNRLILIDSQWLVKTDGDTFIFKEKLGNKFLPGTFWPCLSSASLSVPSGMTWFLVLWTKAQASLLSWYEFA